MGGFGVPGMAQRKNAPKPKQPLKSFNWSKLEDVSLGYPHNKIYVNSSGYEIGVWVRLCFSAIF